MTYEPPIPGVPIKNPVLPGVSCPGASGSGTNPESGLLWAKEKHFLDLMGSSGESGSILKKPSLSPWSRNADDGGPFSLFDRLDRNPILRLADALGDAFLLVAVADEVVPEDGEGTRSLRPLTDRVVMLLILTVWKTCWWMTVTDWFMIMMDKPGKLY